ncbi:hypothetical protein BD770DRAFT_16337 [Pilaira anomala]|nr:hypothetical protein BD770DRAFT_16337 [Pilaira anomala]
MYYVDLNIGQDLFNMLKFISTLPVNTTSENSTLFQPAISIVMHPAVGGFPSAWEFTLIIVVALLAISFLASVGMHWHLWRIRRRQRALFESGLLDGSNNTHIVQQQPTRKLIDSNSLSFFPTRIIGDEPNLTLQRVESNISTRSVKAIENIELLQQQSSSPVPQQPPLTTNNDSIDDACVICLDEFALGEQIRKLPCGHEYHCECIDPWLTIKSASCPLCKHDCSLDVPKSETEQQQQQATPPPETPPAPPSYSTSFFSSFRTSQNNSPTSSFGPTISADRAEEFSRSWMARSLPRNMRRQIHEAAQAAAEANRESVIELPARMTTPLNRPSIEIVVSSPPPSPPLVNNTQQQENNNSNNNSTRLLGQRLRRTLPRIWRSNSTVTN